MTEGKGPLFVIDPRIEIRPVGPGWRHIECIHCGLCFSGDPAIVRDLFDKHQAEVHPRRWWRKR